MTDLSFLCGIFIAMNGGERPRMIFLALIGRLPYIRAMDDVRAISSGEVISAESAGEPFHAAIGLAADYKTRVVVTRDGKPVAAIVPIEDYDALEAIEDAHDAEAYREAMAAWEAEGRPPGIPHEEVLAEYGITLG